MPNTIGVGSFLNCFWGSFLGKKRKKLGKTRKKLGKIWKKLDRKQKKRGGFLPTKDQSLISSLLSSLISRLARVAVAKASVFALRATTRQDGGPRRDQMSTEAEDKRHKGTKIYLA